MSNQTPQICCFPTIPLLKKKIQHIRRGRSVTDLKNKILKTIQGDPKLACNISTVDRSKYIQKTGKKFL